VDEYWHSDIVVGRKAVGRAEWNKWIDVGAVPSFPRLRRWSGLRTPEGSSNRSWTDLCVREFYHKKNRTLVRKIVTGPEDPKVFQLSGGPPGLVELAFSSYPPLGRHGCGKDKAVQQMYLASGVDVLSPGRPATGNRLRCGTETRAEKNWIPFQRHGELYFVYSVLPHVVMKVHRDGSCGGRVYSNYAPLTRLQAKYPGYFLSGSAQAVFVNDSAATRRWPRPHYLALLHIKDPNTSRYAHFAYRFNTDPPFQILGLSRQLPLRAARAEGGGPGIAFASGLGLRDRQVVISYAAGDREARALVMTLRKLDDLFAHDGEDGAEESSETEVVECEGKDQFKEAEELHTALNSTTSSSRASVSLPYTGMLVFAGIGSLACPLIMLLTFARSTSNGEAASPGSA